MHMYIILYACASNYVRYFTTLLCYDMQSPQPNMYGRPSTVSLLEEMPRRSSVSPDEPADVSTMQQLYPSVNTLHISK